MEKRSAVAMVTRTALITMAVPACRTDGGGQRCKDHDYLLHQPAMSGEAALWESFSTNIAPTYANDLSGGCHLAAINREIVPIRYLPFHDEGVCSGMIGR